MSQYQIQGSVNQVLPGGKFKIVFTMNNQEHEAEANISGKIRQFKIKIVKGDEVLVNLAPDTIKPNSIIQGQIVRRIKK